VRDLDAPPEVGSEDASWRERLGGPHAVTLTAWLLVAPWWTLETLMYGPGGLSHPAVWRWLGIGVAAHAASGPVLALARLTVLRPHGRHARPWTTVGVLLLASLARNAVVGASSFAAGLTSAPHFPYRLTAFAVAHASWLALATVVVDGHRRARATRTSLTEQLERRDRLHEQAERLLGEQHRQACAAIRAEIDTAVRELGVRACSLEGAARRLRSLVDDVVRPLSHRLDSAPPRIDGAAPRHAASAPVSPRGLAAGWTPSPPSPRSHLPCLRPSRSR
jgi:hypothetical protein